MNKKLKKLKKFCDSFALYCDATKDMSNQVFLEETKKKKKYNNRLKKLAKLILERNPTQEEIALLIKE